MKRVTVIVVVWTLMGGCDLQEDSYCDDGACEFVAGDVEDQVYACMKSLVGLRGAAGVVKSCEGVRKQSGTAYAKCAAKVLKAAGLSAAGAASVMNKFAQCGAVPVQALGAGFTSIWDDIYGDGAGGGRSPGSCWTNETLSYINSAPDTAECRRRCDSTFRSSQSILFANDHPCAGVCYSRCYGY